jgi:hypothetical protein
MSINKSTLLKSHDIKQPPYIEEYNEKVHNGQKKKYKRTNNDQQKIHIKLKIE